MLQFLNMCLTRLYFFVHRKDPELPAMFTVHCREKKYLQMNNLNVKHNHQSYHVS